MPKIQKKKTKLSNVLKFSFTETLSAQQIVAMADRCNISNYFLRDTKRKLAIPLPQTIVKKNSFSGDFFGIAFLYIDKR